MMLETGQPVRSRHTLQERKGVIAGIEPSRDGSEGRQLMPQPKKHASHAAREAAYRKRCDRARQLVLASKGLPQLPAISTMPGWPRWNAAITAAQELIANTLSEMTDYFDDRSETWQESERGEEHQERINSVEMGLDALGELNW